jgi:hypothetical protein
MSDKNIMNSLGDNASTFSLLFRLFKGDFTLYDYSQLLPLFTQDAFNKISSYIPDSRNLKISDIIQSMDIHKKILEHMPVDVQKQNPEQYSPKDMEEYAKKANCTLDNLKTLVTFIIQIRKAGPRLETLMTNPAIRSKLMAGDISSILDSLKNII